MTDTLDSSQAKKVQLLNVWLQCQKHYYHLKNAVELLTPFLPVTPTVFDSIDDEQMRVWDQFLYRFTKLQDTLGARFYTELLEYLQEPCAKQPMIDKLNRLEQLGLLKSVIEWGNLRDLRNQFSHDYPQSSKLRVSYLNAAVEGMVVFEDAMLQAAKFLNRINIV